MATDSAIDRAFTDAFNEINGLYRDDKLEECIEKARTLLCDDALPRYHRMRTLVLLGSTLEDWSEANACREEADLMWRIVRRWHPAGEDAKVDTAMDDLHDSIVELEQALSAERPRDYDADAAIEERLEDHEAAVAAETERVKAEEDDPEALLAADARVVHTTEEALRALDITKAYGKVLAPPAEAPSPSAPPSSSPSPLLEPSPVGNSAW